MQPAARSAAAGHQRVPVGVSSGRGNHKTMPKPVRNFEGRRAAHVPHADVSAHTSILKADRITVDLIAPKAALDNLQVFKDNQLGWGHTAKKYGSAFLKATTVAGAAVGSCAFAAMKTYQWSLAHISANIGPAIAAGATAIVGAAYQSPQGKTALLVGTGFLLAAGPWMWKRSMKSYADVEALSATKAKEAMEAIVTQLSHVYATEAQKLRDTVLLARAVGTAQEKLSTRQDLIDLQGKMGEVEALLMKEFFLTEKQVADILQPCTDALEELQFDVDFKEPNENNHAFNMELLKFSKPEDCASLAVPGSVSRFLREMKENTVGFGQMIKDNVSATASGVSFGSKLGIGSFVAAVGTVAAALESHRTNLDGCMQATLGLSEQNDYSCGVAATETFIPAGMGALAIGVVAGVGSYLAQSSKMAAERKAKTEKVQELKGQATEELSNLYDGIADSLEAMVDGEEKINTAQEILKKLPLINAAIHKTGLQVKDDDITGHLAAVCQEIISKKA